MGLCGGGQGKAGGNQGDLGPGPHRERSHRTADLRIFMNEFSGLIRLRAIRGAG
jgi:hypothetical protein